MVNAGEFDPFDVPRHGDLHSRSLTSRRGGALPLTMEVVTVPPFESFRGAPRRRVRLLARRLGRGKAEDAFQEMFLRALRGYARLSTAAICGRGC